MITGYMTVHTTLVYSTACW